jgi:hypothetical protein
MSERGGRFQRGRIGPPRRFDGGPDFPGVGAGARFNQGQPALQPVRRRPAMPGRVDDLHGLSRVISGHGHAGGHETGSRPDHPVRAQAQGGLHLLQLAPRLA